MTPDDWTPSGKPTEYGHYRLDYIRSASDPEGGHRVTDTRNGWFVDAYPTPRASTRARRAVIGSALTFVADLSPGHEDADHAYIVGGLAIRGWPFTCGTTRMTAGEWIENWLAEHDAGPDAYEVELLRDMSDAGLEIRWADE